MKSLSTHINEGKNISILVGVAILLLFIAGAFAYVIQTHVKAGAEETVQTLNVFPEIIESDDFLNINALYFQDLSDETIFGDFNPSNSAFISGPQEEESRSTTTVDITESEVFATSTSSSSPILTSTTTATTTSEVATSTEEVEEDQSIIDTVLDFLGVGEEEATTTDQGATVLDAVENEEEVQDNTSTTTETTPEVKENISTTTSTTTISMIWDILRNMFTNSATAQEGDSSTTTDEVEDFDTNESTTTSEILNEDNPTTTPPTIENTATTTSTTTDEIATSTDKVDESMEINTPVDSSVDDDIPPVIEVTGNNPAYIDAGTTYNDLGAIIRDVQDQYLGINYEVDGVLMRNVSIDTSSSGVHTIVYSATDIAGNIGYAERVVVVGDALYVSEEDASRETESFVLPSSFCDDAHNSCTRKSVEFGDFSVPEILEDLSIINAQLRFSFAGRPHPSSLENQEGIVIEYLHNDNWEVGGAISLNEETSNAINGGYYLYALPVYEKWANLGELRVRISYESSNENIGEIYLDALWVEIETIGEAEEIPEEEIDISDEVSIGEQFELELLSEKKEFETDELPTFRFRYSEKKGVIGAMAEKLMLVLSDPYKDVELSAHVDGVEVEIVARYQDDGEFVIDFLKKPRHFKPGRNVLEITIVDGEDVYVGRHVFIWGVLAINVDKSIYTPSEVAYIQMGVVDDSGHTVCDAELELEISKDGSPVAIFSTSNETITYSSQCDGDSFTTIPDYFAHYDIPKEVGVYDLKLIAATQNGTHTVNDTFEVQSEVVYDVERTGPTRIYPLETYPVTLSVTANEDFDGVIEERVPANFEISKLNDSESLAYESYGPDGNATVITWRISMSKGETIQLGYTFDAPDVSPEFYLLGPLKLSSPNGTHFEEIRQWQIAADDVANWGDDTPQGTTTTIDHSRCMGGTSPSTSGMIIESVSIYTGTGVSAPRMGVYTGGTLAGGPPAGTAATLLWDAGVTAGASGWQTVTHPSGGVALAANTVTWICWKGNDTRLVYYDTSWDSSSDFQSGLGRWNSTGVSTDETVAYPATYTAGGSFGAFWYSMYVTYTTPDVTVATTGVQVANLSVDSQDNYLGGTFSFSNASSTSLNVTEITLTETGSVDALNDLSNIRIYYESDTSNPYNCTSESYDGIETQYGATSTSFDAANGTSTFSGSVAITTTSAMCGYVVLDVDATAGAGDTIDVEISDPETEVLISNGGRAWPDTIIALAGSTTILSNISPATPTLAATSTFENMKATTTLPLFGLFSTTDADGDLIGYEFSVDDLYSFLSPATTTNSSNYPGDAGWATSTFASGSSTKYILQTDDALSNGTTYWWRTRATDPYGSGLWSSYSELRAITIDTSLDVPQWYETTGDQFADDTLTKTASTTGALEIANDATISLLDAWSTGNSKSISGGTDRLLIVSIHSEDTGTSVNMNTVTYGGVTMVEIGDQAVGTGYSNGVWMGYITDAQIQSAVGTTITPSWTGGTPDNGIMYSSAVFDNVEQAQPIRDSSQNFDTVGATIQISDALSVFDGDMMVYASVNGSNGLTHTPATNYTEGTEEDAGGDAHVAASAYRAITTDSSEQPTAEWSGSGNRMAIIGAALAANYATGTIMSTEIDFDWVESDNDWGEAIWNTTVPAGASSTLRVYYTNATACDTIIPNGALSGNSTGFSAASSPLDLTGLSTTTYNRICLQMELNHGSTSTSPTLDDWAVSWEKNPILIQNQYRLYANEASTTPTDRWAPGTEVDFGINEAMTSADPIDANEVMRIRMSILASSSPALAGGYDFKLQYALGSSCSVLTTWLDVGSIGSTTAAWRGYDNAGVSDGSTLSSTTLPVSDVFGTYEEENNSATNPNTINAGQDAEYDWVVQSNTVTPGSEYCFRAVTSDGTELDQYNNYPIAYTNDAPLSVTLNSPFDNEALASSSPWFEFFTTDTESEPMHYQIQVASDVNFSSTVINATSINDENSFENLDTPADKAPYNSGQEIRFTSTTTLSVADTTYWWRARAVDPDGSNQYGAWSTSQSFTGSSTVNISTWYQNTQDQFETDTHFGTDATTTNQVTLLVGSTTGTTTSSVINFDDGVTNTANAWGTLSWADTEPGGSTITYQVEYFTSTSSWAFIPDVDLSGNAAGFGSSPVDLTNLNTATYDQIRIRAEFVDAGTAPSLQSWQITWGERVSVPTHILPFDNEKFSTTSPSFTFYSTDPQTDDLQYQFSYSTDVTFTSSTTLDSGADSGFSNIDTPADIDPFFSGDTIQYKIQTPLTASTTYWWRARAKDPAGANSWSFWSTAWSLTTASSTESITVSTWFQDTEEQFETDTLNNTIASTSDAVEIPESVVVSILDVFSIGNTKAISAGANRLLLVGVHTEDSGTSVNVNTVTYGGQLLTEVDDEQLGGGYANGMWVGYLDEAGIALASGSTIVPSYTGGTPDNGVLYSSVVLENVDQTTSVSAWSGNTDTTSTTVQPTTTIAVSEGDATIYFTVSGEDGVNHSAATNFIEGTEENNGGNGLIAANGYRLITADGTEQPAANWGSSNRLAIIALTIQKALSVTSGTVHSSAIDFDDGDGPRWAEASWHDDNPGTSDILYQVQYLNLSSVWTLIPDIEIPGNSTGTSTSPIDLSGLDRITYNQIRLVGNLSCDGSNNCPRLQDWTVTWAPGVTISGTAQEYDQSTNLTSGTVAVAVNGDLKEGKTGTIVAGVWSISNVTAFAGDTITVFISGVADSGEAAAVTKYATGTGNITNMELFERHLSIGSNQNATTTNTDLAQYDFSASGDEDIIFDVDAGNDLVATSTGTIDDVELYIQTGDEYRPDSISSGNVEVHHIEVNGELIADGNTITVLGSWDNNGGFAADTSSVIFTATSTTEFIDSTGAATSTFNDITLGQTSGTATWNNDSILDVDGNLIIEYGTLSASTSGITLAGNLTINANGIFTKGNATTTFDGSVAGTWTDNTATKQDLGKVLVDGTSKTLNLGSNVALTDLTIGANDTLNVTTGDYDMLVYGNWINNNIFIAQEGSVIFATTSLGALIDDGGSSFYNLTFSGTGGGWSFVQNDLDVSNDFLIASGTVTMAVGTTTISGSMTTTDTFIHNNGSVLFDGTGAETITASSSPFYDLYFNGSGGSWAMNDLNATSSNDVHILDGTPTFPSGTLAVGNDFVNSNTFVNNSGTVRFYSSNDNRVVDPGSSSFNNIIFDGTGGWVLPSAADVDVDGDFTILNGIATSTSGTLSVGGSWLVDEPAPGDYLIRRNDNDTTNVTTANLDAMWDTKVASKGSSVSYSSGTFTLAAGKYLVMYNERFHSDDVNDNQRNEIQGRLLIGGTATTTAASHAYMRKEDGGGTDWQDDGIVHGAGIVEIEADSTSLVTRFYRTDSASDAGGTTDRFPDWGGTTILRLDDSWNYARYVTDSNKVATTSEVTWADIVWDSNAEEDTGFSRSGADITITNAGRYLVTISVPTQISSGRHEYNMRLTLNNVVATGTVVSTYMRGNQSTNDGVMTYVGIVDVGAGDVLAMEHIRTEGSSANYLAGSNIQILQLPAGNETFIVGATNGEMNPAVLTEFAWDETNYIDGAAFTHTNPTDSYIDAVVADDYLLFATHHTANGGSRTYPSGRFSIDDVIINYGAGGEYNRNTGTADQAGYSFGTLATGVGAGADISLENIFIEIGQISQTVDTGAASGLRIGSVFTVNEDPSFVSNSGTVLFDSGDTGETIAPDGSSFYDVDFDSATGGWTTNTDVTATNNFDLTNANTFISANIIEVQGSFSNLVGGAPTTWSGSTLYLNSGTDYAINTKSLGADVYGLLQVGVNTDIDMWNSTSTIYTINSSGSLYSQDHNGTDGDLYIWGDYVRSSGTDYWSAATDFDGADLAGSERQVDVLFANNATTTYLGGTLEIVGTSTASTTVNNQGSGNYSVIVGGASTLNAQYYAFRNLNLSGLTITGTPTITSMADGDFELAIDTGSTITLGDTALDANPLIQIQRVRFATTTLISGFNVTATGTPSSFWWFRNHYGNFDGEFFDSDPTGDPGNVRWDDSVNSVTVSGYVYSDEAGAVSGACDGATPVVTIVVDGGASFTGSCAGGDGSFSIPGVGYTGDPVFTAYLDTNGSERAVTVTRTPTVDITNIYLYENRVIVRHEDTQPLAIEHLAWYDSTDDSDILYTAATGSPDTLTVSPDSELHIWTGKTFIPGGNMTLDSGGSGSFFDGTLHSGTSTTLTFADDESHNIGGSLFIDSTTIFDAASTTITFTATTTGKIVVATSTLQEVIFNGSGGEWNIASSTTITSDLTITSGTIIGTANISIAGGDMTGNGIANKSGGTLTLTGDGSFGGNSNWSLFNLTLGDGIAVATTTKNGTGSTTASGILIIDTNHTLDGGTSDWIFDGTGTPFVINGTFEPNNTLVTYEGTGATNITATTYQRLLLAATAGSPTYTMQSGAFDINDSLTFGDGTNNLTVNANANDPVIMVGGTTTINQNATFTASNSGLYTAGASWLNYGTFTHSNGTVTFNASTTGHLIQASTSPFFSVNIDSSTGGWTIAEHATATNNFNLNNANVFTVNPSVTLEVGGQFYNGIASSTTTWTDSTLYLNSGTIYTVNVKNYGDDSYGNLLIGNNTQTRMWNSTSTTVTTVGSGSHYSQDHNLTDGDLYIWGDYQKSSGNDYWSYATDFDGADITGSERKVDVYLGDFATTTISGGTLTILGGASASTTIQGQESGTYALEVSSGTFSARYYEVRDIDATGLEFSGAPTVSELSNGDFLLEIDSGSTITVAGTVINANSGQTYTGNIFATSSAIAGSNVTATGVSVGSWRFTAYSGNLAGEAYDTDPGGDPGYIIWDDSDSQITISGTVYTDEGVTAVGGATCNGSNQSVQLRVAGAGAFSSSCDGSGNYSISGITFSPGDEIAVYLDADNGATFAAANITVDPATNITNMDLYQDRVIVRHEDSNPITNANLAICDSSTCDTDIPFNVVGADLDTDAGTELHIWTNKSFAPGGDITLHGNAGAEPDGTLHVGVNSSFITAPTETHTIGGSLNMLNGATLTATDSTITFNASTTGKIISATSSAFYNLTFNGSGGAWAFPPNTVGVDNDFTITTGTVTLGSATTTVGGSFDNTGGSFVHNNGLVYLSTTTVGHTIEAGSSDFYNLTLNGSVGGWAWQDTNATTSNDFTITSASTTFPSGTLAVGASLSNTGGVINHSVGTVRMYSSSAGEVFKLDGSSVNNATFDGSGGWTFEDLNATSTGSVNILSGSVTMASGTTAISGSFANSGGSFDNATGTIRIYGPNTGNNIQAGGSSFYNLIIDGYTGGWTLVGDATTTNNFDLVNANDFTSAGFVEVQGEFSNLVGGASTTWSGSELFLRSGTTYSVNTKIAGGDSYDTLLVGGTATSTDISLWNSTSTIYTVYGTSSVYSQDHNTVNGDLYIWGDYEKSSGTDYWSYATDFDGTDISGSPRAVDVYVNDGATTTYSGGTLNMIGIVGATTTVQNQSVGDYAVLVDDGTVNFSYYSFRNLDVRGLDLTGSSAIITSLSNGDFELSANGGNMVSVASTTIDNNPTLVITNTRFATSSGISSGFNMARDATSTNAWTITNHYGNYDGESYDDDGYDACGSFVWDDSTCLQVTQEHFRVRNDDGGIGVPDSEWYDTDWSKRQRIRITDTAATTSTNLQVKIVVDYDSDMQSDFDDLRFTDSSGTTSIDYWIEAVIASASSTVWVEVPTLSASSFEDIFVYYGNAVATDGGVGTTTFIAFDDFEDNDIAEYSGDTSDFETSTSFNYEGTYGLDAAAGSESSQTTDGIYRTDGSSTFNQNNTVRFFQYIDMTSGGDDEPCTLFGVQIPGSNNNNYAVCLDPFNTDQIVIAEDVSSDDDSGTSLATENVTFTTGWYEVEIDWQYAGVIDVNVYKGGAFFASTTATDTSYSGGGFGFSFWSQNGGWDFFTARQYVSSDPTYTFGLEQGRAGASWKADEDTVYSSQVVDELFRLRFTVNNSGPSIVDQNFRLEASPKTGYAQCESVPAQNYVDVPIDSGCGAGNFACMSTSSNVTNLAATSQLLGIPSGSTFTSGQFVEDPSNQTGDIDINQNYFTEVEYALKFTENASSSAYCLRTTNDGAGLDSYTNVAEIGIVQLPILTNFTLNSAQDIALAPGATTTIYATGTAIDFNGYADLDYATTTIYRSGVGVGCSTDENNCYEVVQAECSFSSCAGNSCELSCYADMQYFSDPTDSGIYSAEEWLAEMSIFDQGGFEDTETTLGVDVLTLRAITSSSTIPYGTLSVNTDTGNYNATTTVTNDGNDNIDVSLSGTDMTFGISSIDVTNQEYSTTTFNYGCGVLCASLTTTPTQTEIDLVKPTSSTSPIKDDIYWGVFVPIGTAGATHEGQNTFTAVAD